MPPPTSCPRFRDTIQRARYFPRTPEGARDRMEPASATYQKPVPMPLRKLPKMRNWNAVIVRDTALRHNKDLIDTYPLIPIHAVGVI